MNEIKNLVASGNINAETNVAKRNAARHYQQLQQLSTLAKSIVVLGIAMLGLLLAWHKIKPDTRARNSVETIVRWTMIVCALIAVLTTVGIVLSVLFESIRFFDAVPPGDFLFGTKWSPQTSLRSDQVGSSGTFGAIPLLVSTLLISAIALLIAVPLGLMAAIYLSEYASAKFRAFAKPTLEMLAGIPTVVYGLFAAPTVAPLVRGARPGQGPDVAPSVTGRSPKYLGFTGSLTSMKEVPS